MSGPRILPEIEDLKNESDVEQKLLYILLTSPKPHGFGFSGASINTKANIKRFKIGKGKEEKLYYPDYLIVISGLPMLVVEAKAPGEDLEEAYREARLYATELNSVFPTRMNPASKLICSNGLALIAGNWDSDSPKFSMCLNNLHAADATFSSLLDFAAIDSVKKESEALLSRITKRPFFRPTRLLGGLSVRNEEVGHNSFGASIAIEYRHLFNPSSREERAYIVRNAYISSRRRERYIEPIDKFIRAAASPSVSDAQLIEDTETPTEVIHKLRRHSSIERQILLLVGGVGVGKSTFVDYLREVALPEDVLNTTVWVHINMNNAPLSVDLIYDWLCDQTSAQIRRIHGDTDFDDIGTISKVYAVELNRLKKGALKLLNEGSVEYNSKLADAILQIQQDKHATTKALTRYCCGERGKLLIVILDNCDKRLRDEQLLMFQAAQWLRQEFPCLVILPLREETYDNHRNEPPLDTALKDLVFRIEPPSFTKVLTRRVALTLKEMQERSGARVLSYVLPNNIKVEYPAENQAYS